jgi:PAS domain S-box-containing protein
MSPGVPMEVTKLRSQLLIALEQMTAHLRQTQKTLAVLGRSVARTRRLREALGASAIRLRTLVASSRDAAVLTNARFTRQASVGLQHLTIQFQRAQNAIIRLGRRATGKPRRLQGTLRARENGLRKLLASSRDAIVVTNAQRRFVAANPKALDLFGVSEAHLAKFTVDVFLSRGLIPQYNGNGSSFRRRTTKHGKCEVRRLDGSLRVAEYSFVANFVPARHLYSFRNVATANQYQPASLRNAKIIATSGLQKHF